MKIKSVRQSFAFTRAFSTKERKTLDKIQNMARQELGITETSAIIFDFNVPSLYGQNYAIGTLNSKSADGFIKFLCDVSSISKVQAAPQGDLQYSKDRDKIRYTISPYSGTSFTLGIHTIALDKLCDKKYGELLDKNYVESLDENYSDSKQIREYNTDYDYVLGNQCDGILYDAMHLAYNNFNQTKPLQLSQEFEQFKNNLSEYTRKDIEYDADNLGESLDFLEFCQFIATKQHMETKEKLNKQGIKYFGDCLVCFSKKEVENYPECFKRDSYMGGEDPGCSETNNIQPWGSPSLNYDRLGSFDENGDIIELDETGKLLYNKFKYFLTLYDGIRFDAFWQYVTPFEYNSKLQGGYSENLGNKILKIIEKASLDTKGYFSPDDFPLEIVGFGAGPARDLTKNIYSHIYSTAYAEFNENPVDLKENMGYRDGKFLIGMANHDNDTIINMSKDINKRNTHYPILKKALKQGIEYLGYNSENYTNQSDNERQEQDFRTAKAAEIFTTEKQYFTLTDLFGMSEKINTSGKVNDSNWKVRIPTDYERFYYTQLSKGFGINFPKAYEIALRAKGSNNSYLIQKLREASEILEQNGPMTQKEADEANKLDLVC